MGRVLCVKRVKRSECARTAQPGGGGGGTTSDRQVIRVNEFLACPLKVCKMEMGWWGLRLVRAQLRITAPGLCASAMRPSRPPDVWNVLCKHPGGDERGGRTRIALFLNPDTSCPILPSPGEGGRCARDMN
jgi:hypothetical protein